MYSSKLYVIFIFYFMLFFSYSPTYAMDDLFSSREDKENIAPRNLSPRNENSPNLNIEVQKEERISSSMLPQSHHQSDLDKLLNGKTANLTFDDILEDLPEVLEDLPEDILKQYDEFEKDALNKTGMLLPFEDRNSFTPSWGEKDIEMMGVDKSVDKITTIIDEADSGQEPSVQSPSHKIADIIFETNSSGKKRKTIKGKNTNEGNSEKVADANESIKKRKSQREGTRRIGPNPDKKNYTPEHKAKLAPYIKKYLQTRYEDDSQEYLSYEDISKQLKLLHKEQKRSMGKAFAIRGPYKETLALRIIENEDLLKIAEETEDNRRGHLGIMKKAIEELRSIRNRLNSTPPSLITTSSERMEIESHNVDNVNEISSVGVAADNVYNVQKTQIERQRKTRKKSEGTAIINKQPYDLSQVSLSYQVLMSNPITSIEFHPPSISAPLPTSHTYLTDEAVLDVSLHLGKSINYINLSYANLNDDQTRSLLDGVLFKVRSNPTTQLLVINLSHNQITDKSIKDIIWFLRKHLSLEELDLSYNFLGHTNRNDDVDDLRGAINQSKSLKRINLSANYLTKESFKGLENISVKIIIENSLSLRGTNDNYINPTDLNVQNNPERVTQPLNIQDLYLHENLNSIQNTFINPEQEQHLSDKS